MWVFVERLLAWCQKSQALKTNIGNKPQPDKALPPKYRADGSK